MGGCFRKTLSRQHMMKETRQNKPPEAAYEVQPLRPEDIEKYRQLRLRGLEQHPEAFGETAEHFKEVPSVQIVNRLQSSQKLGGFILIAKNSGDEFVGTVGLAVSDAEKMSHRGTLWGMYVAPAARGTGLGRRLVEECLSRTLKLPLLELITLSVVTTNEAAFNLYKALGFRVYGTDPSVLKIGERYFDEYLMVKSLRDNK